MIETLISQTPCSCHSGKNYAACCQPWHQGTPAPTALALMRSRYAAYALGLVDYILETTHLQNPATAKPFQQWKEEVQQFCQTTVFKRLDILETTTEETESTVTFRASLSQQGKEFSFTEKSTFKKIEGKWLYLSGILR